MAQTSASTQELVRMVAEGLVARDRTVATHESLTGGGIHQALSQHPGASRWFVTGVNVGPELNDELLIDPDGVVTEMLAMTMAQGIRAVCRSSYSVVVMQHPVRTVCIAVAGPDADINRAYSIEGDRDLVLHKTIDLALETLITVIGLPSGPRSCGD